MTDTRPIVRLDKHTWVPVGVVVVAVGLILGGYRYLEGRFNGLDRRLERMERDESRRVEDRWSSGDQEVWALKLQKQNPELRVPEVRR